jgi:hypothetical protein
MQSESIFDVSKSHVSAIDLYDALAEISIFHLQDALAAESLDLTVGPHLLMDKSFDIRTIKSPLSS